MDFFNQKGYENLNPGWPGDSNTVAECRANPQTIANKGVTEVADSYATRMTSLLFALRNAKLNHLSKLWIGLTFRVMAMRLK